MKSDILGTDSERKPACESRAAEIRARLVAWKQIPETRRISLRALAVEIGTSHQLLSFYLNGPDKWQGREYQHKARDILARAQTENRNLTPGEEARTQSKLDHREARLAVLKTLRTESRNARTAPEFSPLRQAMCTWIFASGSSSGTVATSLPLMGSLRTAPTPR